MKNWLEMKFAVRWQSATLDNRYNFLSDLGSLSFPFLFFLLKTKTQSTSDRWLASCAHLQVPLFSDSFVFFLFDSPFQNEIKSCAILFPILWKKNINKIFLGLLLRLEAERKFLRNLCVCSPSIAYFRPLWLGPTFSREDFV
jgi:hypothetical protein